MASLSLPSWPKALLLFYLLLNLKSLPFAWHIRVLYHFLTNISKRPIPPKSSSQPRPPRRIHTHPLFTPVSITTRTSLLESDYNLHRSNSTYLSDMDVSRTKLATRLFSPGFKKLSVQLEREGYRGRLVVALGSVHVSFKREVGIYERCEVRSRVVGWDDKWVVIVSYFVRRKAGAEGGEEMCAVALSKYVVKKGRFTVKPGNIFQEAGWLPEKPRPAKEERGFAPRGSLDTSQDGDLVGGLEAVQNSELVEKVILTEEGAAAAVAAASTTQTRGDNKGWNADTWSWEEIEEERLRGLQLAQGWLALDAQLFDEYENK